MTTPHTTQPVPPSDPRDAEITALRAEIERWKWVARDVCAHTENECPPECDSYGHAEHCGVYSVCQTVKNLRARVESLLPLARFGKWSLDQWASSKRLPSRREMFDAANWLGLVTILENDESGLTDAAKVEI